MVNIPSDLRKNKETIIGNMDLRECICLFLGLIIALLILYYIRVVLGFKRIVVAAFIGGIFVIPFLILGFKKINGMKMDDYFKVFVSNKILSCTKRINVGQYTYKKVSNNKYEMIRYYRLVDKYELINLRKYLNDKNILILTEYIDYKNIAVAIFRLDAKDMILDEIKRNKKAINDKKIEIKEFMNNAIKAAKKEKCKSLDKQEKIEFKNNKKIKLKELNDKLKMLKSEMKYLKSKTFSDLKEGVDIFENIEDLKAEKIFIDVKSKNSNSNIDNDINNLRKEIKEDERKVSELHLFNKAYFKDFIKLNQDKIVFINKEDFVDVYVFDNNNNMELVDLIEVDKKENLYKGTILSLEARNYYNNYRKINDLMEMI